jgi:hypothetical protein
MGDQPGSLAGVIAAGMTLWAFCLYCAHASLIDPSHLRARLKASSDDGLDVIADRFRCTRCRRKGVKRIPTPRTMNSFDKMGMSRHGR